MTQTTADAPIPDQTASGDPWHDDTERARYFDAENAWRRAITASGPQNGAHTMADDHQTAVRRRLPWWLAPLAMALAMMACIIPAWTSYVLMHRHLAIMEEGIHGTP